MSSTGNRWHKQSSWGETEHVLRDVAGKELATLSFWSAVCRNNPPYRRGWYATLTSDTREFGPFETLTEAKEVVEPMAELAQTYSNLKVQAEDIEVLRTLQKWYALVPGSPVSDALSRVIMQLEFIKGA